MSNFYFCYVQNSNLSIPTLVDDNGRSRCLLSSSDFDILLYNGYSVHICGIYSPLPFERCRLLRRSHFLSKYICQFSKLPNHRII